MEDHTQGYSVLNKTQVRDKMKKETDHISEIFSLSESDARVILMYLKWDSVKALEFLADDTNQFLSKLGLVQVFDSNSSSAPIETMNLSHGDGDYLLSTSFCSHKFSTTSWSEYLTDALQKNEGREPISCLNQDCVASVGTDLIGKLSESVKEMYESYAIKSFMEFNKDTIKWCPAPGCVYAIELHYGNVEDNAVVCFCGHIFCWRCELESHRPVTCERASLWCNNLLDQSRTLSWIQRNTKPCPNCNSPVNRNGDFRMITCICSSTFCWVCLKGNCGGQCVAVSAPVFGSPTELAQILHVNLFDEGDDALEKAKSNLRALDDKIIPKLVQSCVLNELDMITLGEAAMLSVQCRQVLKWSSVFGYFITECQIGKKQLLQHQLYAASTIVSKHESILQELLEGASFTCQQDFKSYIQKLGTSTRLTGNYFHGFKSYILKLETSTRSTGNYFHEFVKSLEDGMPEVKDEPYENGPDSHWLCARCKFDNIVEDTVCMRCFLPLNPPPAMVSDNSNNSASFSESADNINNSASVSE